jgi:hypothetical protein
MPDKLPKELQEALRNQPADVPYRAEDDAQTPWVVVRLDVFERMQRLTGEASEPGNGEQATSSGSAAGSLPEWCNVYAGLSEDEIDELESVILNRADLSRAG